MKEKIIKASIRAALYTEEGEKMVHSPIQLVFKQQPDGDAQAAG